MIFQAISAGVWAALGVVMLASAKTAMHEIVATLLLSFAVLFVGVACMLYAIRNPEK